MTRKVLIAANDTRGAKNAVEKFMGLASWCRPESVVLLYVEKYDASFLMDEMLGDSELSELKAALEGTEYQEAMDRRARKTLERYKKLCEDNGITDVKTVVKVGHPAEEIINTAREEGVDMIVLGSRGKRFSPLMMGSVSREVANGAEVPVLLIK